MGTNPNQQQPGDARRRRRPQQQGEPHELFRQPVIATRWLFTAGVCVETLVELFFLRSIRGVTALVLALLCLYSALALAGLRWAPRLRRYTWVLLFCDLLLVGAAARFTGNADSPYLAQCYLVIIAGALLYGFVGGFIVGLFSALIAAALAMSTPNALEHLAAARDIIPSFPVAGGFAGYLSHRLRLSVAEARSAAVREERLRADEEALHRDLDLARKMQVAALPTELATVPGVSVAVRWHSARTVGGDFYTSIRSGDRMGLIVGDASGKGMPAALVATSISYLLPRLDPLRDPCSAIAELNRDLETRLPPAAFVTMVLAAIEPAQGRARIWSAGHPPALHWSASDHTVRESGSSGPLLGALPDWSGSSEEWPLGPGDVIILYTDGLIETRSKSGELFEVERTAAALAACAGGTADAIAEALVCAAKAWGEPKDDLTVVVCKRDG